MPSQSYPHTFSVRRQCSFVDSILLVRGLGDSQDYRWAAAQTHIISSMRNITRIYSWEYDERAILCDFSDVKTTLDVEAKIFWDAIERYRTKVSLRKGSPEI